MTFKRARIVACEAKPDYILWIRFDDGIEGEVNLSDLAHQGVFKAWESEDFWKSVKVDPESETVCWGEEIDLDPYVLKQEVLDSQKRNPPLIKKEHSIESINPIVQHYVDGWKKGNESEILDTLAEDCLIIESHGPTYRGKKIVQKWIEDWHKQGNVVKKWKITSYHTCGDLIVFEWIFAYNGKKNNETFEGVSLAKIKHNKIYELREYRATQFPFMWGM